MPVEYRHGGGTLASFGDYSPLSCADGFTRLIAIAGQFGTDAEGTLVGSGDAADQVRQAFRNVGIALGAAGLGFNDVVKFTTYLVGRETVPAFMSARREVFAELYPDRLYPPNTLLLVAGLVEEHLRVEIEALAVGT